MGTKSTEPVIPVFGKTTEVPPAADSAAPPPEVKPETASTAVDPTPPAVELVKMVRDENYPEPHTAEVHPDEVVNYTDAGWTPA